MKNKMLALAGDYVIFRAPCADLLADEGALLRLLDDLPADGVDPVSVEVLDDDGDVIQTARVHSSAVYVPPEDAVIAPATYQATRQMRLPYGMWTNSTTGRRVLFDRRYQAIWESAAEGKPFHAAEHSRIDGCGEQTWFYDDACLPRYEPQTVTRIERLLRDFGISDEMRFALPVPGADTPATPINRALGNPPPAI